MSENLNRRVAKNTFFLYLRMLFLMFCAFYTSRIVLNALGVVDYGIYNVVAGLIGLLGFFNNSMTLATNRFMAFALGKKDLDLLRKTFAMSLQIHFVLALIIVIIAETIGLWYFYNYLNVPSSRLSDSMIVYQISIITAFISILFVPFISLVISHEDMSTYARLSVLEGVLKLLTAYLLVCVAEYRLVLYAFLIFLSTICMNFVWYYICKKKYDYCRYKYCWDKQIFDNIKNFIGWQFLGSLSWVLRNQGITLVLNMFFGASFNAVRAISLQVSGAMTAFVANFQTAVNPQLIKTFAQGEYTSMHSLIYKSSKMSFFLFYILALPILLETEPILELWLHKVPDYGVIFVRLMVISVLFDLLSGTLSRAALATANIRNYQLIVSLILLCDVFVVFVFYKMGYPAVSLYYVEIALYLLTFIVRLFLLRDMIHLSIGMFLREVFAREILVVLLSSSLALLIYWNFDQTFLGILGVMFTSVLLASLSSYFLGLNKYERFYIQSLILSKIKR